MPRSGGAFCCALPPAGGRLRQRSDEKKGRVSQTGPTLHSRCAWITKDKSRPSCDFAFVSIRDLSSDRLDSPHTNLWIVLEANDIRVFQLTDDVTRLYVSRQSVFLEEGSVLKRTAIILVSGGGVGCCHPSARSRAGGASSISGSVVDSAGGAIPGAAVVVNNEAGVSFETVTNAEGLFNVPAVRRASTRSRVKLAGFKTAVIDVSVPPGTPAIGQGDARSRAAHRDGQRARAARS